LARFVYNPAKDRKRGRSTDKQKDGEQINVEDGPMDKERARRSREGGGDTEIEECAFRLRFSDRPGDMHGSVFA